MRHLVELGFDCRIDGGMVVSVDVCPDRGVAIDVFATVPIPEDCALSFDENDWIVIGRAPRLHLRKGMPDVALFSGDERIGIHVRESWGG